MNKVYFNNENVVMLGYFADESFAPEHTHSFELADGQSTFAARYALVDGALVDKYEGKTDDEVVAILQAEHDAVNNPSAFETPKGEMPADTK